MFITNKLAIGTAVTTLSLLLTAQTSVKASTFAGIPIEEEFVSLQWLYADISWLNVTNLLTLQGFPESDFNVTYNGTFNIFQDSNGDFFGDILGNLSGKYLGEDYSIDYIGVVTTDDLSLLNGNPNKILDINFTSKGKWKQGPFKGKDFTDMGTIKEAANNQADVSISITNLDNNGKPEANPIPGSPLNFKISKNKDNVKKKLTLKGPVEIPNPEDPKKKITIDLEIVLDQMTKKGTSKGTTTKFGFDFDVFKNDCEFTYEEKTPNPKNLPNNSSLIPVGIGSTSCNIFRKTPEPTSILSLLALGTLGAASTLKRKLKPSKSTEKGNYKSLLKSPIKPHKTPFINCYPLVGSFLTKREET